MTQDVHPSPRPVTHRLKYFLIGLTTMLIVASLVFFGFWIKRHFFHDTSVNPSSDEAVRAFLMDAEHESEFQIGGAGVSPSVMKDAVLPSAQMAPVERRLSSVNIIPKISSPLLKKIHAPAKQAKQISVIQTLHNSPTHYYLIAGSFSKRVAADEFIKKTRLAGFSPVLLPSVVEGKTFYRVHIAGATRRSDIELFQNEATAKGYDTFILAQ